MCVALQCVQIYSLSLSLLLFYSAVYLNLLAEFLLKNGCFQLSTDMSAKCHPDITRHSKFGLMGPCCRHKINYSGCSHQIFCVGLCRHPNFPPFLQIPALFCTYVANTSQKFWLWSPVAPLKYIWLIELKGNVCDLVGKKSIWTGRCQKNCRFEINQF